jgi:hypothetical protein
MVDPDGRDVRLWQATAERRHAELGGRRDGSVPNEHRRGAGVVMDVVASVLMMLNGVAIAAVWTRDIVAGEQVDLSKGFFAARDPDAGTLFWPHWLAEYATAAALIAGGLSLLFDARWDVALAGLATGALLYTSVNSLGWSLARRDRRAYAFPMVAGIVAGLLIGAHLLGT